MCYAHFLLAQSILQLPFKLFSYSEHFTGLSNFELAMNVANENIPLLVLKAPITTAADDKVCNIFSNFQKKIRYDITRK